MFAKNVTEESYFFYRYLKRFDDEVEQINLKQSISKNRSNQHASRLSIIKMTLDRENAEYNGAGIGKLFSEYVMKSLSQDTGRKKDVYLREVKTITNSCLDNFDYRVSECKSIFH